MAIPTGVAAFSSSDMFKKPCKGKPRARDWTHRMTNECRARQPSSLKQAAQHLEQPGIISLGGGLPTSDYFPFESLEVRIPSFPGQESRVAKIGKFDIVQGKADYDLHTALNYGQSTGAPPMVRFITQHTEAIHNPPYDDWQCATSVGSTSSLEMVYRMFVNAGDYLLTECFTFSTAAECARPLGAHWVGVEMDAQGLLPSSLDAILTQWDASKRRPSLLYTVPTGQNPTGATQSLQRRQEIYQLAQKHDLLIIEDEPYYFLQMEDYGADQKPQDSDFLARLVPSYLSMDVDGRVIRLDSFAKVIGPGFRTGWITAPAQIVERYTRHCESSVQNPAGTSQILLYHLLDKCWGQSGYLDWLFHLRMQYTHRRNNIVTACERYLPREIASWEPPMAGMFHWIKIDWTKHPAYGVKSMVQIEDDIYLAVIADGALTSKGSWFRAAASDSGPDMFFRTTFAAAPDAPVREAIKRMGQALRRVFGISSPPELATDV